MITTYARSLSEFLAYLERLDIKSSKAVFRGQDRRGGLLPGIARDDPSCNSKSLEIAMLGELDRLGASMLPPNLTQLDKLVFAQHHGMKTRLLDWSQSALTALWFACSGRGSGDAYVYALGSSGLEMTAGDYEVDPFELDSTKVFLPRMTSARVNAQHGLFTIHRFSVKSERFVPLEDAEATKDRLIEFVVPASERPKLLSVLNTNGVNARTLFPDLDGLCRHLNNGISHP